MLAPNHSVVTGETCVTVLAQKTGQIRMCRTDTCTSPVPSVLVKHGVCLEHYLDDVFTEAAAALQHCQRGRTPDAGKVRWLQAQGDLAVRMLSGNTSDHAEHRGRLLELLLCLAHVHECLKRNACARKS